YVFLLSLILNIGGPTLAAGLVQNPLQFEIFIRGLLLLTLILPLLPAQLGSFVLDAIFVRDQPGKFLPTLRVLLVLSAFVLPTVGLWPLFNQIWTGDWRTNTYTLLWSYDTPGFGPNHGLMPGGHTIEYGWRNARTDMVVYLRDLFGWTTNPDVAKYLAVN